MDEAEDRGHLYGYGDPTSKRTRLQEIVENREKDVEEAKSKVSSASLQEAAAAFATAHGAPQSLADCLEAAEAQPWGLALAAEFKRASPSKGDINIDLDAAEQALEYSKVGSSVLSVLTVPRGFKGSLEDLKSVRLRTQKWAEETGVRRPVCLRKDFLTDEYQVLEALAHGADTLLLMVSILPQTRLRALIACCREHGMEPLVEVVTLTELKVALAAGARILGVNNRNLHTFELDKGRTAEVTRALKDTFKVAFGREQATKVLALSGLSTAEDVAHCREIGCSGVLVGEALMRATDVGASILAMMGPSDTSGALPVSPGSVLVKVCGVLRPEDASCAIGAGANLIGVIFAKSKRQASVEQARAVADVVRRFGERAKVVPAPPLEVGKVVDAVEAIANRSGALRRACHRTPLVVGVFMDQPLEEVVQQATAAGVDAVQLHGKEDIAYVEEIRRQLPTTWVFKVVHLPPKGGEGDSQAEMDELKKSLLSYGALCDALLLDTAVKGSASGGTGEAFDWKVAQRAQEEWGVPVIVAGGLTDANVGDLVASVGPFGVDVASGVEDTTPGVKNSDKTQSYVRGAKRARVGPLEGSS